ncbi:MAG: helix-turn-helix transcriptional regulator [Burkholderiaceae bacterium]
MGLDRLMKEGRTACGVSQLELALRLGVSQRHISFIERGNARPSRQLLMNWMDAVEAPLALRNAALIHGGYTTDNPREATALTEAARTLLEIHDPMPACCVDRSWRMVAENPARARLSQIIMPDYPAALRAPGSDMIAALEHPHGFLSNLRHAGTIGWTLLRQLRAESWANANLRARADDLEASLVARFPRVDMNTLREADCTQLVMEFETDHGLLQFRAVQAVAGLPQNATASSPRVSLWYPANDAARAFCETAAPLR